MGDIVGSERVRSIKTVHRAFNGAIEEANALNAAAIASPLTITLGDEFQGLLVDLAHAWDIAIALRLRLLMADVSCRFVTGVTELETPLNAAQAWNMMGSGLSNARDKLNDKRPVNAYRFSLPGEPIVESLLDAVGDALTHVELAWTPTQLRYYTQARNAKGTNAQVAEALRVSTRSLYKVLRAGRADLHQRESGAVRSALQRLDERYSMK